MPSVCTPTLIGYISNKNSFEAWKTTNDTTLNTLINSTSPTSVSQKALNDASLEIFNLANCLYEKLNEVGTTTDDIQKAQTRIIELNKEIRDAEDHVKIAKDRVAYIRNPVHTSYYESWFPMGRPMQPSSIPFFIAINVFLITFILLLLGSYVGLNISLALPYSRYPSGVQTMFTFPNFALAFLVGFIIYYFLVPK